MAGQVLHSPPNGTDHYTHKCHRTARFRSNQASCWRVLQKLSLCWKGCLHCAYNLTTLSTNHATICMLWLMVEIVKCPEQTPRTFERTFLDTKLSICCAMSCQSRSYGNVKDLLFIHGDKWQERIQKGVVWIDYIQQIFNSTTCYSKFLQYLSKKHLLKTFDTDNIFARCSDVNKSAIRSVSFK